MANTTTTTIGIALSGTTMGLVFSNLTYDYREANLELTSMFDRSWEKDLPPHTGDRVLVQGFDTFQAEADAHAEALGVGGTATYSTPRFQTNRTIIVDTHAVQGFEIEYEADLMSNLDLMDKLAKAAAHAVAHRIDDVAAGFADDSHSSQAVGSLLVGVDDIGIRRGVQYLDDAFAPQEDRFFVFSAAERRNLESIDKYINALYGKSIGSMQTGKMRGYLNTIYGLDWYHLDNIEGTNAAGHDNYMFHRSNVAAIVLENMRVTTQLAIDEDSQKYQVHSIFGMLEIRTNHGVYMRGL